MSSSFDIIWEQLTCAICTEQLKQPKVLGCLHTFCADCLKAIHSSDDLSCPLCRRVTNVAHGVDALPSNFLAVNLLETLARHDPSYKASKNPASASFWQGRPYCPEHLTEEYRLYCEDCEKPICRDCALVEHRPHRYVFLQQAAQRSRSRIQQSIDLLKLRTQTCSAAKSQCETDSTRISDMKSQLRTSVLGKTLELINHLKVRQEYLLEQIEELCNKKDEENILRLTRLEEILRTNAECTTFVERSLSTRDADYIRLDTLLSKRIEELLSIQAPSPLSQEDLSLCLDLNDEDIISTIEEFGSVYEILPPSTKEELQEELQEEGIEANEIVELEIEPVQRGFLFYFLLFVFILCHCVPVFVALSKYKL